ncbi:MAG TPA: hypothetical protein VFW27_21810, partial [Actinoplanes sp.]|nr:hypothetical protein [Actinoplanes sp.]
MVALALGTGVEARRRPRPGRAPAPLVPPRLTGSGRIGEPVAVDPGTWSGGAALRVQWTLNDSDLPGATGQAYIPVAADDRGRLAARVIASNAAGTAEALTEGLAVTRTPPHAAGRIPDLTLFHRPGFQTVNAATDFTGEALSFGVTGEGVSVDPATGVLRILTDALRDGIEVVVTATNSGGAATSRFRVTVVAEPVEPVLERPTLIAPPALAGSGRIGEAVEVDPGLWSGQPIPEIALQWLRDGAAIDGATGSSYVPVAADDRTALGCRVTASNAAGSAEAEAGALAVTRAAPAAVGTIADQSLVQGSDPQTVEAAGAFAGEGLVFAVDGGGATIDAATGRVTIETASLMTAAEVTVTASNSGGAASASFRVTVARAQAKPSAVTAPSLAGSGKIGAEVVADPGTWTGFPAPTFAFQWRRGGQDIGGATAAAYVPVEADDRANLTCRVTASNAAGSADAETAALAVTRVAPAAVGTLDELVLAEGSGVTTVDTAAFFIGGGLVYAVTGGGATIDAATGRVSIPATAPLAAAQVVITASNSGGSAQQAFGLTVEAAGIAWPEDVADELWTVAEVTSRSEAAANGFADEDGHLKAVFGGIAVAPAGFRLKVNLLGSADPAPIPGLANVKADSTVYTTILKSAGDVVVPRLYWYHTASGAMQLAGSKPPITLQGLEAVTPPGWIAPSSAILADASSRNPEYFGTGDTTVKVGGHFGAPMAVLAYASFTGNTSTDAKVLAAVRNCLAGGKAPCAASGFSMQHEAGNWAAVAAYAKLTPRLWNQFTAAEKAKIDILMKALAKAAAWSSSDKTSVTKYTLAGVNNNYPRGNANYQMANPFMLAIMIAYMGSVDAADGVLRNTSAQSISSELQAQGMSNTLWAWKSPRPANAPSFATIDASCKGWTFKSRGLSDMAGIFKEQMQRTYGETAFIAHPKSASIGGRGKLMGSSNAALNAWVGKVGMPDEMNAVDGGGIRTSAAYATFGLKMTWNWFLVMLASGQLAKNDAIMKAVKDQVNVGYNWYDKMITIGWLDYAKGGSGSGNGDFRRAEKGDQYGMGYNLPMWLDVVYPM